MSKGAESWADQWSTPATNQVEEKKEKKENKMGKKMDDVKKIAATGFFKAKAAAVMGAAKLKVGTSHGVKFVKEQYQKTKSSSSK